MPQQSLTVYRLVTAINDAYDFHKVVECPTYRDGSHVHGPNACTCRAFDDTREILEQYNSEPEQMSMCFNAPEVVQ